MTAIVSYPPADEVVLCAGYRADTKQTGEAHSRDQENLPHEKRCRHHGEQYNDDD